MVADVEYHFSVRLQTHVTSAIHFSSHLLWLRVLFCVAYLDVYVLRDVVVLILDLSLIPIELPEEEQ